MPIESPQLDDLRFDRTVEELKRRIPVYAKEWTDHNDSDPGIAMIQLFAYLAEQVGYRLNRIPEKNHVELLKLLGIRLKPAHAAASQLALLLTNPSTLTGYTLKAGARAKAKKGTPPPVYETDVDVDVVPAEALLLVTTTSPRIDDVLLKSDGTHEVPATYPKVPNNDTEWLAVTWDGKAPKLKDMPIDPVPMVKATRLSQKYLWVGLDYNAALDAGFRGVRVTLSIQLDDDEKPDLTKDVHCETPPPVGETPSSPDWVAYWDAVASDVKVVPGRIDDTTAHLARSGTIRFTVPLTIGPIASWKDMRGTPVVSPLQACLSMGTAMTESLAPFVSVNPLGTITNDRYRMVLDAGVLAVKSQEDTTKPPVPHPLDPTLRANAKAWLRLELPPFPVGAVPAKIRIVSFNTVAVTNATTVKNELLGRGDGRPGQQLTLANGNVLDGSLVLAIQEDSDETTPLVSWSETESLDAARPFDSVYELDPEAGVVSFGDGQDPAKAPGRGGRIPPLVPTTGEIVALTYRWGGAVSGEVPVASIATLDTAAPGIAGVVNFVAATGGRDAETLDEAKLRAKKELSTRTRAVTADDFEWIALQTPAVRVARAHIVPLRRPLPAGSPTPMPPSPQRCGPALPGGPNGLAPGVAPGAVTVVVVPDEPGPEPLPTPSFLRAVCRQLDRYRLVTTEVHVVPPQYCRICKVLIQVQAEPGYTRSRLQELVEATLGTYLHVLKGGEDGKGFPFGAQLHVADLIARVFRTEGVARVEQLSAEFTRTKSNGFPRQGQLVLCPTSPTQMDKVLLAPEENVSIDVTTINLATVV